MMIQMLVHAAAPLRRRQIAEEWMRMFRAPAFPAVMKLANLRLELLVLAQKIPLVGYDEFRVGRIVFGEVLLIPVNRFEESANHPPDQNARRIEPARG